MSSDAIAIGGKTSKPSLSNKTGSWRTFVPLITDKCTACSICTEFCPDSCINIKEIESRRKAVIDYDYCKGCLVCLTVCPLGAIEKKK